MEQDLEKILDALKQDGKRITPQRMAICQLLVSTDRHPTAQQIYDTVRLEFPSISLATVYNTLDALAVLGVINVLGNVGDDTIHYDADTSPHVNLACVICHKVIDLPSQYILALDQEIESSSRFRLLGARVLYYGVCPECQASQSH